MWKDVEDNARRSSRAPVVRPSSDDAPLPEQPPRPNPARLDADLRPAELPLLLDAGLDPRSPRSPARSPGASFVSRDRRAPASHRPSANLIAAAIARRPETPSSSSPRRWPPSRSSPSPRGRRAGRPSAGPATSRRSGRSSASLGRALSREALTAPPPGPRLPLSSTRCAPSSTRPSTRCTDSARSASPARGRGAPPQARRPRRCAAGPLHRAPSRRRD